MREDAEALYMAVDPYVLASYRKSFPSSADGSGGTAPATHRPGDRSVTTTQRVIIGAGGFGRKVRELLALHSDVEVVGYPDDRAMPCSRRWRQQDGP